MSYYQAVVCIDAAGQPRVLIAQGSVSVTIHCEQPVDVCCGPGATLSKGRWQTLATPSIPLLTVQAAMQSWSTPVTIRIWLWLLIVVSGCAAGMFALGVRMRRSARRVCSSCGYDLTGNVTGRCSECGHECSRDIRYTGRRKELS